MHKKSRQYGLILACVALFGVLNACATPRQTIDTNAMAAQAETTLPNRAAIVIPNPRYLKANIMGIEGLRSLDPPVDKIRFLVYGKAVHALVQGSEMERLVQNAMDEGVQFVACKLAIDNQNIDEDTLLDNVEIVPNIFVEAVRLQQLGWHTTTY